MNPEDRLRSALDARAAAARTSPDALDGVFTKVSRRRRNARLAAAGGTALSLVAVVAIGTAVLREPADQVVPSDPSPSVSTAPAPSTSPSPSPSPAVHSPAPNQAVVILNDGRIVEIDTSTGAVLHTVDRLPEAETVELAYSRVRHTVVVESSPCGALTEIDIATGRRTQVGTGYDAAYSPDGTRLASAACLTGRDSRSPVQVRDLATGRTTTYWPPVKPRDWPATDQHMDSLVAVSHLTWRDDRTLVVARSYEDYADTLLLDVGNDTSLADATRIEGDRVLFTVDGEMYGLHNCCRNADANPTYLVRIREGRERERLYALPHTYTVIGFDATGVMLFGDNGALWRWEEWRDAGAWPEPDDPAARRLPVVLPVRLAT